ncbi:hypothetical protein HA466_0208200 [Hirschfeldia incana]|nr:hypothetical protein HA466_0208200 [Hirschfeldia incana]
MSTTQRPDRALVSHKGSFLAFACLHVALQLPWHLHVAPQSSLTPPLNLTVSGFKALSPENSVSAGLLCGNLLSRSLVKPKLCLVKFEWIVMDQQPEPVTYVCGDCGQENTLKSGDVIQCRECGYRILYKKRTRRVVQYEAR